MESSTNDACTLSVDTDAKLVVSNSDNSENCENHENREKFDNSENKIISISEHTPIINDIDKDADDIPKTRQQLINEYYTNLQKQKYERFIEITMNQTTYTREEAIASLEKHKGDITLVIKEFLGVKDNRDEIEKQKNSKSLNQKRYSVIRECMDNAARNFAKKQQQAKMYSEFIEKQKRLQEEKQEKQEKQDRQDKEI
jgi:NACalpha-BTF3-like transcription factor